MNTKSTWGAHETYRAIHQLVVDGREDVVLDKIIGGAGQSVGEAITYVMGMGYLPLAQKIMERTGAGPAVLSDGQVDNIEGRVDPLAAAILLYGEAQRDVKTYGRQKASHQAPLQDVLDHILQHSQAYGVDPNVELTYHTRKTNLLHWTLGSTDWADPGDPNKIAAIKTLSGLIDVNAGSGRNTVSYEACSGGTEGDRSQIINATMYMSDPEKIAFFSQETIDTLKLLTGLGWDAKKHQGPAYAGAIAKPFSWPNDFLQMSIKGKNEMFPVWDHLQSLGAQMDIPSDAPREINPLAIAVEQGLPGLFKSAATPGRYCKDGANLDWVDPQTGDTLLHLGSIGKKMQTDTVMSVSGARWKNMINRKNNKGDTALHLAVAGMDPKLVEYLLKAGADVSLTNAKGKLPLETVRRTGPKAQKNLGTIAELIEQYGGSILGQSKSADEMLMSACAAVNAKMALKLIDAGANLEYKDKNGRTPLLKALHCIKPWWTEKSAQNTQKNQRDLVVALLKRGADVSAIDEDGNTALHLACERFCEHLVAPLLKAGADPYGLNKTGRAPIDMTNYWTILVEDYKKGWRDDVSMMVNIVKHFMDHGCDMFAKNAKGELPFAPIRFIPEVEAQLAKQNLEKQMGSSGENAVAKKTRKI